MVHWLKYAPGFPSFDYVNARAPKGGAMRQAVVGIIDNLQRVRVQRVWGVRRGWHHRRSSSRWSTPYAKAE
jgi:hypothetical protein